MRHEDHVRQALSGGLLAVAPGAGVAEHQLCRFALSGDGDFSTGLTWLGGDLLDEYWSTDLPVRHGREGDLEFTCAGGLMFIALLRPDDGEADPEPLARRAYHDLLSLARREGCPRMLRIWNYLPAINAGDGDAERYRRFCLGRAQALEAAGVREAELCAGTAIGSREPRLRVYALTGVQPGVAVENPRQVSAFRYPPVYGPRSPSFARATALPRDDGRVALLISGTASVVGHATAHAGRLEAQVDETLHNLQAVMDEAARLLQRPALARVNPDTLLRVYVRYADDWPPVRDRLRAVLPAVRIAGLHGDICRRDLLMEVEAVHIA